jgi:hypothetical protein
MQHFTRLDSLVVTFCLPSDSGAVRRVSVGSIPPADISVGSASMYPPHTVAWALFSFLRQPHRFYRTLFTAVRAGGDTDTCAACAGAISGAYNGFSAIMRSRPDSGALLAKLQDRSQPGRCNVLALRSLARSLHAAVCVVGGASGEKPRDIGAAAGENEDRKGGGCKVGTVGTVGTALVVWFHRTKGVVEAAAAAIGRASGGAWEVLVVYELTELAQVLASTAPGRRCVLIVEQEAPTVREIMASSSVEHTGTQAMLLEEALLQGASSQPVQPRSQPAVLSLPVLSLPRLHLLLGWASRSR